MIKKNSTGSKSKKSKFVKKYDEVIVSPQTGKSPTEEGFTQYMNVN